MGYQKNLYNMFNKARVTSLGVIVGRNRSAQIRDDHGSRHSTRKRSTPLKKKRADPLGPLLNELTFVYFVIPTCANAYA